MVMMIQITNNDINFYIDLLKSDKKFSFTRWGDGEWLCTFGASGANCDGHSYFLEMRNGLNRALDNPKGYFLATWPQTESMMTNVWDTIQDRLEYSDTKKWVDASVWEEAAMNGNLKDFIEQLEKMDFIVVSESSKKELPMNYSDFIEVPETNCFLEKERIKEEMVLMCDKYDLPVFGLSASMATNVIVDELYDEIGDSCWMIDLGSIWEPFLKNSVHARSYHSTYKTTKLK